MSQEFTFNQQQLDLNQQLIMQLVTLVQLAFERGAINEEDLLTVRQTAIAYADSLPSDDDVLETEMVFD